MRLPRDLSGKDLIKALKILGYSETRQSGSHVRLTTTQHGEHYITIPLHVSLRIGTLAGIISDVASHFEMSRDEILQKVLRK